jgi:hypothetical protein
MNGLSIMEVAAIGVSVQELKTERKINRISRKVR